MIWLWTGDGSGPGSAMMDEVLLLLLRRKAHQRPLRITTGEIGTQTGMSQQNASRRIIELEEEGMLGRTDEGITLKGKAVERAGALYACLKSVMEPEPIELEGTVEDGLGEGRYYMSLEGYRSRIKERLGFEPYPGTLNIRLKKECLWKRGSVLAQEPIVIDGFRGPERSYGDIYAYRCEVEGRPCALIVPLRTHHGPEVLELIAPWHLKDALGIGKGDMVKAVFR